MNEQIFQKLVFSTSKLKQQYKNQVLQTKSTSSSRQPSMNPTPPTMPSAHCDASPSANTHQSLPTSNDNDDDDDDDDGDDDTKVSGASTRVRSAQQARNADGPQLNSSRSKASAMATRERPAIIERVNIIFLVSLIKKTTRVF